MKRRFIFLVAFALMALMTPLGAKGQTMYIGNVYGARYFADVPFDLQFNGVVSHIKRDTHQNRATIYIQDNEASGGGIEYFMRNDLEWLNNLSVGRKVTVIGRVTRVGTDYSSLWVDAVSHTNYGMSTWSDMINLVPLQGLTLQDLKDAHYPISRTHTVEDHYQDRLVKLTNLRVIEKIPNHDWEWIVEDVYGVRDTLCFYDGWQYENSYTPQVDYHAHMKPAGIQPDRVIEHVIAINTRDNGEKLFVRNEDDYYVYPDDTDLGWARKNAHYVGTPEFTVTFTGVVSRFNDTFISIQTPNNVSNSGAYAGMLLKAMDFRPSDLGITIGTKLRVTGQPKLVSLAGVHVYDPNDPYYDYADYVKMDVTSSNVHVISQNCSPQPAGTYTLSYLKRNDNLTGVSRANAIRTDVLRDRLVKVENLTIESRVGNSDHPYRYVVRQGNVTDYLYCDFALPVGVEIPQVTLLNTRRHGSHYEDDCLYLRSFGDLYFDTKTINYARTHLNQTHHIEGVITSARQLTGWAECFIQDNTGGLCVGIPTDVPHPAVGDRVILHGTPIIEASHINSPKRYTTYIATTGSNQTVTPVNTDIASLYQQDQNNPMNGPNEGKLITLQNLVVKEFGMGETALFNLYQNNDPNKVIVVEPSMLTEAQITNLRNSVSIGSTILSITGVKDYNSSWNYKHKIWLRSLDDIQIQDPEPEPDPLPINLSFYPTQVGTQRPDVFYATLNPHGSYEDRITQAAPGTTVYLIQKSVFQGITGFSFVSPYNNDNSNWYDWDLVCTNHPDLEPQSYGYYTQNDLVNIYSFVMPDSQVTFEGLFGPGSHSKTNRVRQAAGNYSNPLPSNAPFAKTYGMVTHIDNYSFIIQDPFTSYEHPEEELDDCNAVVVEMPRANHNLQIGQQVNLLGYAVVHSGKICLVNARVDGQRTQYPNWIMGTYPTTLAAIEADITQEGSPRTSKLQSRLVQLNSIHVEAKTDATHYTIKDMSDYKTATLIVPSGVELSVGSTIGLTALNWSAADSQDIELILRSAADITGANDITISTYAMDFDEFGSGLNSSGSAYLWINVPISIGSNLANLVEVGSANVSYTGEWIYDGTEATIEPLITTNKTTLRFCVPANTTSETRTCAIVVHAGNVYSQPLIITQTGSAPAEFTVNPDFQSFGPVDPNYSKGQYSQSGYINITDISHVAQPYGSHITTSVASAYEGQDTDWFSLGAWDAENQRFPFTIANNNDPSSITRGVNVAIIMEGTDGTLVQHEAAVHQSGPGASVTVTPNWWTAEAPLCQQVTKTFEVNYSNFDLAANPARIWLEAADFNNYGEDVEISIEPSGYVELTEASGTIFYQVTFLVKNAGSHYGTFKAKVQEQDNGDWWDSFDSQEASVWVSGLHPYNIDTKATSIETLNSLGIPEWTVWDPDTYQPADTLWFIHVSIASEVLGKEAEMLVFDPENGSYISCNTFDPTLVSGSSLLVPLRDGTYLVILGPSRLAWDSEQGLYEEWVPLDTPDDIANIPASCKWNVSFSGDNIIISPSTNPDYSLRCQSVTVTEPDPENWEETISRIEYHIVCVTDGGTPLQAFYHIEGELPSPTFSDMSNYFEDGQAINVTLTPAANTSVAYCLDDDYDNFVVSETPVTITVYETTKVSAWSMLECQTGATLDGLVEHTYYKINTIAEARLNPNTEYYIHGFVSSASHGHNRCYVQDETSGVEIGIDWTLWENQYNNHDTLVSLQYGDEIVLKGWCNNYGQFTGATFDWNTNTTYDEPAVARLSTGNTVTPLLVTFDELYETTLVQYFGRLVKLQNEQVTVSDFYPETYQLRHGTPEEPYYMEFSRYLENSDEMFPLNNGDIIDLTAVYDGGFSNPKEITVKTPRSYDMQAYTDVDLTQPNTGWDSHIKLCDAYGNILNPNALYAGNKVYFTFDDGYGVGYNAYLLPVAAVYSDATNDLIADTYTNFEMGVTYMNNSRDRLFSFNMPDEDIVIKVFLMNAYTLTVYNNNMTQVFDNVTLYFGSVNTMGIPESWLDNYYMTDGSVATGEAITMPYTVTANMTLTSVYQHSDEKYGRVFYQDETMTNLVIERPSVVLSDVTLTLDGEQGLTNENAADFVIEEGGSVDILSGYPYDYRLATVRKSIVGYGNNPNVKNGWYLLSTPFCDETIAPATVTNMIASTPAEYDLYAFNQGNSGYEWRNYKTQGSNITLRPMEGRLYANKNDVELSMSGNLNAGPRSATSGPALSMSYTDGNAFAGWNLVGNPFLVEAYVKNDMDYYRLQDVLEDGEWQSKLVATSHDVAVNPLEGIFVQATGSGWLTMVKLQYSKSSKGMIEINLVNSDATVLDRAMVRFDEGDQLGKFTLNDNGAQLCITQDNEDYAMVRSAMNGEVPVNFKAMHDGSYTLSIEAKDAEMTYLHLIDTLTGADVDLLTEPTYTFEATAGNNAARFRLVFNANEK